DLFGCVSTLPRSGRRPKLSHSDELKLVKMFKDNPGTTKVQIWQELETAGMQVSLSTVKRVLHCVERPKLSSKNQDDLLLKSATGAELAQQLQKVGMGASACAGRRKRAAKKPLLSEEKAQGRLEFCQKYIDWTTEDWCKVIFSDMSSFRLFATSGKGLVRRKDEASQGTCMVPAVIDPDPVHVWGCFSSKGVGSLTVLPKDTSMDEEWYQTVLQEQLLPTIPFLKKRVDKQKSSNCEQLQTLIRQEWFTLSRDLVQKFISSMPERIAEVVKKQGQPCEF
uniref:Transposase Tc1-like domain-containing protein n=1 Tax=Poecilia formosa TaxID=48698 RepID=A0A087Y2N6_POEFO